MSVQKMQYIFMLQVEQFQRRILGIFPEKLPQDMLQKCLADKLMHLEEENMEVNKAVSIFKPTDIETYYEVIDGYIDVVYVLLAIQWLKRYTTTTEFQDNIIHFNFNLLNNIRRILPPELPYAHAFNLVHKANMAKISGEKPGRVMSAGFDAIKPKGWKEPNWPAFCRKHLMKRKPCKTLILGDAQAGKDTYATFLRYWYGYKFVPAFSVYEPWLRVELEKLDILYNTRKECYEDRVNHRALWYTLISEYNGEDSTRLTKDILLVSDIYPGIRAIEELHGAIDLFDRVIYINALDRIPAENRSSNDITLDIAQAIWRDQGKHKSSFDIVENNHSLMKFVLNIHNAEKSYG